MTGFISNVVNNQIVNPVGHTAATSTVVFSLSTLLGGWNLQSFLGTIALIFSILWYALTIYESKTVQGFVIRFRAHLGRTLKNKGWKKMGQHVAKNALTDAVAVVEKAKVEVADAKDTAADAAQAVQKP
jgi:hypothetical protein